MPTLRFIWNYFALPTLFSVIGAVGGHFIPITFQSVLELGMLHVPRLHNALLPLWPIITFEFTTIIIAGFLSAVIATAIHRTAKSEYVKMRGKDYKKESKEELY